MSDSLLRPHLHHGGYHHQPVHKKDDGLGLAPLLLTLPLLLGLGALLFAATNGSNTVVNVNVNTTQTNTNGNSVFDIVDQQSSLHVVAVYFVLYRQELRLCRLLQL